MTIGAYQQQQRILMQNSRNIFAPTQPHPHLTDTKGLLNGPGQNNCFLNCAVQVSPRLLLSLKCSARILMEMLQKDSRMSENSHMLMS